MNLTRTPSPLGDPLFVKSFGETHSKANENGELNLEWDRVLRRKKLQ